MNLRRVVGVKSVVTLGTATGKEGMIVEKPELLLAGESRLEEGEFAVVVTCTFGFPQRFGFV